MTAVPTHGEIGLSTSPAPAPFVRILGIRVDCLTLSGLLGRVREAARSRQGMTVLYVNVHCMNVAAHDAGYAEILERAGLVYCDGTGVRLAGRILGKRIPQRMTGADWIHDLCRLAVREGLSLYLLGGREGSASDAARALSVRHPGLRIVGWSAGYGAGAEAIRAVNMSGADILLVGMGTPTQEAWIDRHRAELDLPVVWAVGALFDFVSGRIPRGPACLTDHGFEWLCRLAAEPRKLWRRYLVGNPAFFWRVLWARFG